MRSYTIATIALVAVLTGAASAYARAEPQTFHATETTIDTGIDFYSCFEGRVGNGMTTDVTDGHFTPNANGFHFAGVVHRDYTLAFADGTHVVGHLTEHISFNATPRSVTDTEPSQEEATVYSADGRVLGTIRQRDIFHIRYADTNRNGQPDPGEITSNFERVRVTCP